MQRPMMNPMLGAQDNDPSGEEALPTRRPWVVQALLNLFSRAWRMVRWCFRCLFSKPLARRKPAFRVEEGPWPKRLAKGVAYRLLFAPILVVIVAGALVYSGTHPRQRPIEADPSTAGLYYDPISFVSGDGTRLTGWLIPVVNAKQVVEQQEDALRNKHPAVVLVHDYGKSPQQVLPYLAPLYEDGFVTLAVGLRGTGSGQHAGQTFGLREAEDVAAAVEVLRRRPFVDPERVAIIGIGTGAIAAARAAAQDPRLKALVLMDPVRNAQQAVASRIGPTRFGLQWMQPVCKWTFELTYGVDAEDIAIGAYQETLKNRPVLEMDRTEGLAKVRILLKASLGKNDTTTAGAQ